MGGIAVLVGTDHVARFGPLLVGAGISTVMFLAGSGFCVCAALPAAFDLPGSQPESWRDDIQQGRPLGDSLSQQAEHYQSKIADNRNVLQSNATLFRRGAVLGILAPIAGGVAGAIVSIWL